MDGVTKWAPLQFNVAVNLMISEALLSLAEFSAARAMGAAVCARDELTMTRG